MFLPLGNAALETVGKVFTALFLTIVFAPFQIMLAQQDTVYLTDKAFRGTLTAINADTIEFSGRTFTQSEVTRVLMGATNVVARSDKVFLTNGTILSGALWETSGEQLVLRSTSLGEISIPISKVAAIILTPSAVITSQAPKEKGKATVFLNNGTQKTGKFFAASAKDMVFETESGMDKISVSDISVVLLAPLPPAGRAALRNGDRIGAKIQWKGNQFSFELAEKQYTLGIDTLKEVKFAGNP